MAVLAGLEGIESAQICIVRSSPGEVPFLETCLEHTAQCFRHLPGKSQSHHLSALNTLSPRDREIEGDGRNDDAERRVFSKSECDED